MRNNGQPKLSGIYLLSTDTTVFIVSGHRRQRNSYQTDNVFLVTKSQFALGSMIFCKVSHFSTPFLRAFGCSCRHWRVLPVQFGNIHGELFRWMSCVARVSDTTKTTESTNYDSQDGRM